MPFECACFGGSRQRRSQSQSKTPISISIIIIVTITIIIIVITVIIIIVIIIFILIIISSTIANIITHSFFTKDFGLWNRKVGDALGVSFGSSALSAFATLAPKVLRGWYRVFAKNQYFARVLEGFSATTAHGCK